MNLEIRVARESDADELAGFMNKISAENLPYLAPFGFTFNTQIERAYIVNFTRTENAFLLVGVKDKEIVAALDVMPNGSIYKNSTARMGVLVKKEYRGMGIGTLLCAKALELVAKAGRLKKVEAEIFTNNLASKAMFLKLGFTIDGQRTNAYYIDNNWFDVIYASYLL